MVRKCNLLIILFKPPAIIAQSNSLSSYVRLPIDITSSHLFFVIFYTVRHKVKDLVELVQDDDRLKQERKRSKKNRDKYKGVSSEDYTRNYSMLSFVH